MVAGESEKAPAPAGPWFLVTNHARRLHAAATNNAGDKIVWWLPNCHEKNRVTLSAGGTSPSQMLNTYHQGVYYQLTARVAFANFSEVIPDDSAPSASQSWLFTIS